MKIYLDVCCLCRPFDNHRDTRIRLETEAVLAAAYAGVTGIAASANMTTIIITNTTRDRLLRFIVLLLK